MQRRGPRQKSKIANPHAGSRLIMGKNCLREVLHHAPKRILQVFTSAKRDPLLDALKQHDIPIKTYATHDLSAFVQSESHQSFVAAVRELPTVELSAFLEHDRDRSLVLMCDSINDPQNFGALLRAAECFGVDAVVWSKNRGVDLTPSVSKASVGASELVPLIKVSNLAETVSRFQEAGYTAVVAESQPEAQNLDSFDFPARTLLIVGSEGKGVQPLISKRADTLVKITMQGQISSLNVSQATAILLCKAMGSGMHFGHSSEGQACPPGE